MDEKKRKRSGRTRGAGCLGGVLGCILSAALNGLHWYTPFHLILGWLYVLYAALWRSKEIVPAVRAMFGV